MADLEVALADHVLTITLNRPQRRNAFTFAMLDAWSAALRRAADDDEVRVVLVRGAGDHFCSGVDLDDFAAERGSPYADKTTLTERVHQVARAIEDLDKPVIAAVAGVAYGAGMDMALLADIRIAADTVRLSEAYIRVGLLPGDGGCYLLPRIVGMSRALELLWTGRVVTAEEASRIGLVSSVHPAADLDEAARSLAAGIAAQPPLAVRMIKRTAYQSARTDLRTSLDLISSHQAIIQSTADSVEAMAAFREGRSGDYHGH